MFSSCSSLTNLDLSNFNTANVTQMTEMISGCTLLENLNINNFIISQDPIGIGNSSLKSISVCNGKVIGKGAENLFGSLYSLETVDLAGFDTSEATSLYAMFAWCSSLKTIDLTSFNVHKVNNYNRVFSGCRSLVTIYANNWLNPDEIYIYDNLEGQNIFEGCDKLVGGKGTKLGVNYIYGDDGSLLYYYYCSDSLFSLHIDGGWETPGLFTEK